MNEAKAQRDCAEAKLMELRGAGENAWEALKDDAEATRKAFKNSVNYFKSHFK